MPRALLLSYHFPPSQAAGAHRWGAFTHVGVRRGWSFDVIAATPGYDPAIHAPRERQSEIRVHVVPPRIGALAATAGRVARAVGSARRNRVETEAVAALSVIPAQVVRRADVSNRVSIENARKAFRVLIHYSTDFAWMRDAEKIGSRLASTSKYDVVISSGPPHLAANAARRISEHFGIPLVVDFRDPWSQIDMLHTDVASPLHFALADFFEQKSVARASLAVMNTDAAARVMREKYPEKTVVTVRNGFDRSAPPANHQTKFVAIFAGEIYLDRDPRPLLTALQLAASRSNIARENFVLRFIGSENHFGGTSLQSLALAAGVGDLVEVTSQLKRDLLHQQMASAALLVNLPQGARLCIPSKIYEYLNFPSWILAMEPAVSATRDLLSQTSAHVLDPADVEGIARVIQTRFEQYQAGIRPKAIGGTGEFSAEKQASQFFDALEPIVL